MKIVYVIPKLGFGGAETQLFQLASRMQVRGHTVRIFQILNSSKTFIDQYNELGINVVTLGMKKSMPNPFLLIGLRRELIKFSPDVVHSHIAQSNIFTRLANWRRFPLISTAHSSHEKGRFNVGTLYRYTDSLSHWNTNVSDAALDRYTELGLFTKDKSDCVPNGVDTQHFCSGNGNDCASSINENFSDPSKFTFLSIGRFVHSKNFQLMLRSIAKVDANLLICGEGPMENELKSLVAKLGITDRVSFVETMVDVKPLYLRADAFIMSSTWEGLPMVLLEAMAMSVPILSTKVSGASFLLDDGLAGQLAAGFDVNEYTEALENMMQLPPAELERMGEHGRKKAVDEFSIENISELWIKKYRYIIEIAKPCVAAS